MSLLIYMYADIFLIKRKLKLLFLHNNRILINHGFYFQKLKKHPNNVKKSNKSGFFSKKSHDLNQKIA